MAPLTPASSSDKKNSTDNSPQNRKENLINLVELYHQLDEEEKVKELRSSFINNLQKEPDLLNDGDIANFLAQEIDSSDLAELEWDSPEQMVQFSEALYQTRFLDEERANNLRAHAITLVSNALYRFEKEGDMEKLINLLSLTPFSFHLNNVELNRIHYRAHMYETRRVRRHRRYLFGYLLTQIFLVLIVFPLLFINAENGRLQNQVEQLTDVEIGDEGYRLIPFTQGVYWSVITAASIGYGDITPRTTTGRIIAAVLGTMGVITVGIIAGLVLEWITPRRFN